MAKVTLLTHTPQPERIVAAAAKLCYSASGIEGLLDGLDEEKSAAFVGRLMRLGHESPLEHAVFTFGIEGVSRALLAQITRHRIATFSVQSQRYVAGDKFGYVIPPQIEKNKEAKTIFLEEVSRSFEQYERIAQVLAEQAERELTGQGMDPEEAARTARKQANEDARFLLPNACDTKMILSMNARSLLNFFRLRCCMRAQWEIRGVAEQMLRLVCAVAPALFAGAGPGCVSGGCPEGSMSCGRADEMRAHFRALKEG